MKASTKIRNRIHDAINRDVDRQLKAGSKKNSFGHYWEIINGVLVMVGASALVVPDVGIIGNAQPTEGLNNMFDTTYGTKAKPAGWYLGLYANAINPASTWTAATVAATAGEINSTAEGYTQTTRPQYTPNVADGGIGDNVGEEATFTIATASTLNVEGVILISSSVIGGTAGVLGSAARYPATRQLQNADSYKLGFRVTFTG